MSESSPANHNSTIVNDIIETFTYTAMLSTEIRNMLIDRAGGNPVSCYLRFKKSFNYLYMLSSDHKDMINSETKKLFLTWRDKTLTGSEDIHIGLKLFDTYKTELYAAHLLTFRGE
ncbi:MAG TPA: hypothetical protein VMV77_02940 [Bacteroidales bacterium]|nr:hypothetical protein [Bacteroidales bacterium]